MPIVNTPSKVAKAFYSRIERLGVFIDSVFTEFEPCVRLSRPSSSAVSSREIHPQLAIPNS
ncbi:hypothetical protein [Nostoc sp. FACHB-110]|uniref:hypothetical protein n=1 Tax=Nostoc sp. FACHB-110 TaxID=2692834 RepID=UPI00168984E9|nr:hypothetical protein [Nostoc sp. FACHB-110]